MSFYYNIFYSYIISCYLKKKKNTKIHSVVMVTDSYIWYYINAREIIEESC